MNFDKWPDWLRWILVLPASLGAYFGIQVIIAVANSFAPVPESMINLWCKFINSIAGPAALVWVGAIIAPKHKFVVAITITVIHAILNAIVLTLAIISGRHSDPTWLLVGACIIGIVSTIVVCVMLHEKEISVA